MLERGLEIVLDAYAKYAASGVVQLLLIGAITLLLIKEKKLENRCLAYYVIIITVIISLPPVAYILTKVTGASVYWRVFWLIPSTIIVALTATSFIDKVEKKPKRRILFVGMLLIVILGGRSVYEPENFTKSTNLYKLPQESIDICEMVAPHNGTTKMVVPETIVSYIRQYNANIELLYGRDMGKDYQRGRKYKVLLQLNSLNPDYQFIVEYCTSQQCEYIVFENTTNNLDDMINLGYELYEKTENYTIFKITK